MCVTVTLDQFENVTAVCVHDTVTVPCRASPVMNILWYYQQYCDNFEHGLYLCSTRTTITIENHGEQSLLISDVTKNMTGLYICEDRESHSVISSVFLIVVCKYNFVLFLGHLYP